MGRAIGYQCDRPECQTFVMGAEVTPNGWLTLTTTQNGSKGDARDTMVFCGNVCLGLVAAQRCLAVEEVEAVFKVKRTNSSRRARMGGPRSGVGREALDGSGKRFTEQAHTRWHVNRGMVEAACPWCDDETRAHNDSPQQMTETMGT